MSKAPDQKLIWDKKHASGEHDSFRDKPSTLARMVEPKLVRSSSILDLGCGTGRDAAFFARSGHKVIATDLSTVAINRDKQYYGKTGVDFQVQDMQKPFPFEAQSLDLVFANLSLHYYSDEATKKIVDEIVRVLKTGGLFVFSAKSVNDFHYGNGEEVEENVFVSSKGHIRHLFSLEYTKNLIADNFELETLEEVQEVYSGEVSHMIFCVARKGKEGWL